ncbi:serine/threonine-protein kinase [Amycolatopsis sp. CA-230715]|uniref:serine/threonine-protein kinase n=1 Tax=Amycolatopsis sp. CA-230715 TaxID=2745196 RepID=UPI001C3362EA|nr:serine/threonine-protein kinase [Amycolatopsis sp. CA-230715]QWF85340.1 Serine/threonine-protein kinase PknD [Amycolatopsis sp. CA-230715]
MGHPADRDGTTESQFVVPDVGWPAVESTPEPPSMLGGRYEVGRLIGRGGTARVHRAFDTQLNREVAVKVFHHDALAVEQRRRLREITILSSLDHPCLVPLYDTGEQDGQTFLVMRLVDGENLADRLQTGPMSPGEVTELAKALGDALAHVHERGITHRDLKPANILLGQDGPMIGDFGIARALDMTRVTATGAVAGTAAYLAPEQVLGQPVGAPADVYSLGLVLIECLTAEREYDGSLAESAVARLNRPPRVPVDVPPDLVALLRWMTASKPSARPTAAEVTRSLTDPGSVKPRAAVSSGHRWRRPRVLATGAVVTAAAAAFTLILPGALGPTPSKNQQPAPPTAAPSTAPPPPPVMVTAAADTHGGPPPRITVTATPVTEVAPPVTVTGEAKPPPKAPPTVPSKASGPQGGNNGKPGKPGHGPGRKKGE